MAREKREFKTLEEFREHQRKVSREWYKANREKKLEYQRKRYYSIKSKEQEQIQEAQ